MTTSTVSEKLRAMAERGHGNPENDHLSADSLLLQRLRELGDDETADAYVLACNSLGFWYV